MMRTKLSNYFTILLLFPIIRKYNKSNFVLNFIDLMIKSLSEVHSTTHFSKCPISLLFNVRAQKILTTFRKEPH